jgi:hypothetical protein
MLTYRFAIVIGACSRKKSLKQTTKAFFDQAIDNVDADTYCYNYIKPNGTDFLSVMQPFFAPNKTAA